MQIQIDINDTTRPVQKMANVHIPVRPVVESFDRYMNDLAAQQDAREKASRVRA